MGNINVSGRMARKSVVKDMNGNIINLIDETDGGWIIRNRQVVNPEKFEKMPQAERDRREAALAASKAVSQSAEVVAARAGVKIEKTPDKVDALEKKVEGMESNIAEILKLLKK